jgi:hypothetical protein
LRSWSINVKSGAFVATSTLITTDYTAFRSPAFRSRLSALSAESAES